MPLSRQAFRRKSPKWSSADRVIYPQEIPSLDAMCRTLLVSPAYARWNVSAEPIGSSLNSSIMHSPMETISGM